MTGAEGIGSRLSRAAMAAVGLALLLLTGACASPFERPAPLDAEPLRAVYADDAHFRSHPFRGLQSPVGYARWAFADEDERLVECRYGEPVAAGSRASVEWWALLRRRDGTEATLAGVSVLRFDAAGLVVEERDYWHLLDEARPPNFS